MLTDLDEHELAAYRSAQQAPVDFDEFWRRGGLAYVGPKRTRLWPWSAHEGGGLEDELAALRELTT